MQYQWTRVLYQYNKLPALRSGEYSNAYGGNIEFELFSFFEACYHLKDWVKNGEEYAQGKMSDVEAFINSSDSLQICADICNRLKHYKLRSPRSSDKLGVFKLSITTIVKPYPEGCHTQVTKALIETHRGEECCFNLADDCISEWRSYFKINSLQSKFI